MNSTSLLDWLSHFTAILEAYGISLSLYISLYPSLRFSSRISFESFYIDDCFPFQIPQWCITKNFIPPSGGKMDKYPLSDLPYFPIWIVYLIDVSLICSLFLFRD